MDTRLVLTGYVKWFDPIKGFGFIEPEDDRLCDGKDVFFHHKTLKKNTKIASKSPGTDDYAEVSVIRDPVGRWRVCEFIDFQPFTGC